MITSAPRSALSVWLLIALAAGCARNSQNEPEPGAIGPTDRVFRSTTPGLSVTRTPEGRIAVQLIRGPSSFYSSNAPLYVVDDQPFQPGPGGVLTGLNPHDIETIKLLKDPAETGIYGIRGANGVILITTKKPGKKSG
ncbi:MAG: TonB-dependent receptor plug domain-containing protein [Gemmatimonadaceae bacterium]